MGTEAVSYPFYRLSPDTVKPGVWEYSRTGTNQGEREILGAAIESWDYMVDLEFTRKMNVDLQSVLNDCKLMEGAVLVIIVLVSTAGQRIRKRVQRIEFACRADKEIPEIQLGFDLDGETLQQDLRIDTEICIGKVIPRDRNDPFSPVTEGSRIWSDSVSIALEGSLSRFPMSSVSFRQAFGDVRDAAWMLHWSADSLESSASSALRLYLNEDSDLFSEITECSSALCDVVQIDVLRQILVRVLSDPDFDMTPDSWPQYSLGGIAAQWISNIFGEVSPDQLRSRACSEPGWIEARIHSYMRSGDAD